MSASITPIVTAPRLRVLVNGTAIPALSAEINSNNYYHADAFKVTLLPSDPKLKAAGFGPVFWCADGTCSSTNPVSISVQIDPGTTKATNWVTLISGRVDNIDWEPQTGELTLDGRDRIADFIETKTFETYKNQTSSDVANRLATEHGLKAQVTPTTTRVGRYYSANHDKLTLGNFTSATNEWDLLTYLAQHEGFDVFVTDTTLHFQPSVPPGQNPVTFDFDAQSMPWLIGAGISPKFQRTMSLARDIEVTVQSHDSKTKTSFKVTAKATGARNASPAAVAKAGATTTTNYVITRPNLTHEAAQKLANIKLAELSKHERVVTIDMPGDVTLTPRQGLKVTGTRTDFDMFYYVTEVHRRIDAEGFTQSVTAKNQSPKDTTTVG